MQDIIDLRGLRCPLPVLKARKALKSRESGAVVTFLVTDPSAPDDFKDLCAVAGHEWGDFEALDDHSRITLKVGP